MTEFNQTQERTFNLALNPQDVQTEMLRLITSNGDIDQFTQGLINRINKYGISDAQNVANLLFEGLGIDRQGNTRMLNALGSILTVIAGQHGDLSDLYLQQLEKTRNINDLTRVCELIGKVGYCSLGINSITDKIINLTRNYEQEKFKNDLEQHGLFSPSNVNFTFIDLSSRIQICSSLKEFAADNTAILSFIVEAWNNTASDRFQAEAAVYSDLVKLNLFTNVEVLLKDKELKVFYPLLRAAHEQSLTTLMGVPIKDLITKLPATTELSVKAYEYFLDLLGDENKADRKKLEADIVSVILTHDPKPGRTEIENVRNFVPKLPRNIKSEFTVEDLHSNSPIRRVNERLNNNFMPQDVFNRIIEGIPAISCLSNTFVNSYIQNIINNVGLDCYGYMSVLAREYDQGYETVSCSVLAYFTDFVLGYKSFNRHNFPSERHQFTSKVSPENKKKLEDINKALKVKAQQAQEALEMARAKEIEEQKQKELALNESSGGFLKYLGQTLVRLDAWLNNRRE